MALLGFVLHAVERVSEPPKSDLKPVFINDSADDQTVLTWVRLAKTHKSRWTGSDFKEQPNKSACVEVAIATTAYYIPPV